MATQTVSQPLATPRTGTDVSALEIARAILAPLASLKLTVFLLVLAVFVVFIATLQQTRMDMWTVKSMHYANWIVPVDYQTLFVQRWFPDARWQTVPSRFFIPSGKTIIFAMLINLAAAHLLRFRLQARGARLITGIVTALIAGGVTWAIIFNTQGADGFQKSPPIPYHQMWVMLQVVVFGLCVAAISGIFLMQRERRTEKLILGTAAFLGLVALGVTIVRGESAFIGDSGMRILWQLGQATIAALVAGAASVLLFNRKAGIVLLHIGLAGLMLNELFVTYTNDETRMSMVEGETATTAIDVRATELAIIDRSDPKTDRIIAIPESRFASGTPIDDPRLPFVIQCTSFYGNSDITRLMTPNESVEGLGQRFSISPLPANTGSEIDLASTEIELTGRDGKSLGRWQLSQLLYQQGLVDEVAVDDQSYKIGLRFKTEYKPYAIKLKDVSATYYTGTKTPESFSSVVDVMADGDSQSTEKKISMNDPLRFGGETFYQSGYDDSQGTEISTLQVVRNHGWMIPYVCCMFVVVGLAGQFLSSLSGFLGKEQKTKADAKTRRAIGWQSRAIVWGVVGTFTLYVAGGLYSAFKPVTHEGMRLDLLGQIPVTQGGRVQPLDSLARNTVLRLSKRETVLDGNGDRQPAIRWLADTIFQADAAKEYLLFRIEDLEILERLDLPTDAPADAPQGTRFRYSLDQLKKAPATIRELLPPELKTEDFNIFQSRLADVLSKIQFNRMLAAVFDSAVDRPMGFDERVFRLSTFGDPDRPRMIPLVGDISIDETWGPLGDAQNQNWIIEQAKLYDVDEVTELPEKLLANDADFSNLYEMLVREQVASELMSTSVGPQLALKLGARSIREAELMIVQSWDSIPDELREPVVGVAKKSLDQKIIGQLALMNGGNRKIDPADENRLSRLFEVMTQSYRAKDAATFNQATADYLAEVKSMAPEGLSARKMATEKVYTAWSPFYVAMVIYIVGFIVVALAWVFGSPATMRAATGLVLLALLIQVVGLVMRVVISGRPPITNLYSSALAVSAFYVAMMLLAERFLRNGIAIAMACVGAFGALLWAWSMTLTDGDTFSVLVAVLDTQFWLSTHVVCISIGYSASFAAGALGLAWIFCAMAGNRFDRDTRRSMSNVVYGITCFALFFSFFGTVLGGLWGDDSWGRFWGWDPKENGALMIVLWNAVVLHARWAGIARERGIAILAVLGNVVVLWSWKGVNVMGVGLHSYAGTDDNSLKWVVYIALVHLIFAGVAALPFWGDGNPKRVA